MSFLRIVLFLMVSGLANVDANSNGNFQGTASFYADMFVGRKTANGEIYQHNKMTCAHRSLPFGTKLKVTNLANNKSVIVTVNDRGPFVGNRVLDLSKSAASQLKMVNQGVAKVSIQIIKDDNSTEDLPQEEIFPIEEESLDLSEVLNF